MTDEDRALLQEIKDSVSQLVAVVEVTHTMVTQLVADMSIVVHEVRRLRNRVADLESEPPRAAE